LWIDGSSLSGLWLTGDGGVTWVASGLNGSPAQVAFTPSATGYRLWAGPRPLATAEIGPDALPPAFELVSARLVRAFDVAEGRTFLADYNLLRSDTGRAPWVALAGPTLSAVRFSSAASGVGYPEIWQGLPPAAPVPFLGTSDGGETWTELTGLRVEAGGPTLVRAGSDTFFATLWSDPRLFRITAERVVEEVYLPEGATVGPGAALAAAGDHVCVTSSVGLLCSDDLGAEWYEVPPVPVTHLSLTSKHRFAIADDVTGGSGHRLYRSAWQ
jgi:hypothetical protein